MPVQPPEIIEVDPHTENVACDGDGVLGHPRVWYAFGPHDRVTCGYCDREYVHAGSKAAAAARADFPDRVKSLA